MIELCALIAIYFGVLYLAVLIISHVERMRL